MLSELINNIEKISPFDKRNILVKFNVSGQQYF